MKNLFALHVLLLISFTLPAQEKPFKITISSDIGTTVLIKKPNLVHTVTDTLILNGPQVKHSISISSPQSAILETDLQQVVIWMIPGFTLDVTIQDNQFVFGGQAALFADYFQNKQNNFINFCHYYYQRNPDFNEDGSGYMKFLDSVTAHQIRYFKKYFTDNRSLLVKQFMEEEMSSIYYENLSRKLLTGDYDFARFKIYQKLGQPSNTDYYNYSDKVSFTDPSLTRIHFYQQFAGQFVADIAAKKQKELSNEFSFPQYIDLAMSTIEKLTTGGNTRNAVTAIFLARVLEEMERKGKAEWKSVLEPLLDGLYQKSGNKDFARLKQVMTSFTNEKAVGLVAPVM